MNDTNRSREAINAHIQHVETEVDLLRHQVDGWCIWPLLRFPVFMALSKMPLTGLSGEERINLRRGSDLQLGLRDTWRWLTAPRRRVVVFSPSSSRTEVQEGKYKDVYFDDLLLEIGSYFKIEEVNNRLFLDHSQKALVASDMTSTSAKLIARALGRSGFPKVDAIAQELSNEIQQHFGLDSFPAARIRRTLALFYWARRAYAALFRRVRPTALLMVTAYTNHAIVAAARECGVRVIEFQHGLIDGDHTGYSWPAALRAAKPRMPIPDQIFVYGDYWKAAVDPNGFWGDDLVAVGSLRLDNYRRISVQKEQPLTLVLTTQGLDTEKIISFLSEFAALAEQHLPFRLYIKLHPRDGSQADYQAAFGNDARFCILRNDQAPSTFELIARSHFHMSIYSTCHYEALGLGVPTIILPFHGHETVLNLCPLGCAFLADSPQALLQIIQQHSHTPIVQAVSAQLFKPGALANMCQALRVKSIPESTP